MSQCGTQESSPVPRALRSAPPDALPREKRFALRPFCPPRSSPSGEFRLWLPTTDHRLPTTDDLSLTLPCFRFCIFCVSCGCSCLTVEQRLVLLVCVGQKGRVGHAPVTTDRGVALDSASTFSIACPVPLDCGAARRFGLPCTLPISSLPPPPGTPSPSSAHPLVLDRAQRARLQQRSKIGVTSCHFSIALYSGLSESRRTCERPGWGPVPRRPHRLGMVMTRSKQGLARAIQESRHHAKRSGWIRPMRVGVSGTAARCRLPLGAGRA